jgi:bla regulator protein blaR1
MIDIFVTNYLPRLFDWVIETSMMASIVVGLILCVKLLLREKLTPRWQYILWMIVLVRLLLPWSPESSYSIYSIFSYGDETSTAEETVLVKPLYGKVSVNKPITSAEETFTTNSSTQPIENTVSPNSETTFSLYTIIIYVWLAGVILFSITTFIMNRRLLHYIRKQPIITDERIINIFESCKQSMAIKQDIPLLFAGKIASPTVCGFLRPKLLLSEVHMKVLDERQLRYIFYHELAHIKRKDVAVNWLMHSLLIINWFNPILWFAYSCMREDQELACDALALTYIDSNEKTAYGHTIIRLLEHYASYYQTPGLANLSRNKKTLKRRILMIKKFQKKSYRWSALGIVAVAAVASVALFNAPADGKAEGTKEQITAQPTAEVDDHVAVQAAMEKLFGSPEQARVDFTISAEHYQGLLEDMKVEHKFLTKEEFDQFVQLQLEATTIMRKSKASKNNNSSGKYDSSLLSENEQHELKKISEAQQPLTEKVQKNFTFTVEEAQKLVDFQIKKPTYTAKGHQLIEEKVQTERTIGELKPIIISDYKKGEFGYTIFQSPILENKKDPFTWWVNGDDSKIDTYELEGVKISFKKGKNSNMKTMKMIVPAKEEHSAYQVVIVDSILNKKELEKIMLSLLN